MDGMDEMAVREFAAKMKQIEELLNANNFAGAESQCQALVTSVFVANTANLPVEDKRRLAQMNAAITVELGQRERADEAIRLLKQTGDTAYSVFLRARLLWLQEEHFATLTLLEAYYQPERTEMAIHFPENSPFFAVNADTQQCILNIMAHAYKFFGLPALAAACAHMGFELVDYLPAKWQEYSNYLFDLHYIPMAQEKYAQEHMKFNELFKSIKQLKHNVKMHSRHQKIRVGYIGSDFRQHVCLLFIWAMLTNYDPEKFEVYIFTRSRVEDDYSALLKQKVTAWYNISDLFYPQAAQFIHEKEIDILVDLAGHASGNALPILAYKPAPIQICGIGYFATTGLKAVDYFLADRYLVNERTQSNFVEKLLVLPHSHFCYVPLNNEIPAGTVAPCKKKGYVTFGSFNNLTKVNDDVLVVWAEILKRVPGSHLLLKGDLLGSVEGRELIRQKLMSLGIEAERLELEGFSMPYLERYYDMDIALDTFPYPGGGTTCDALYMGVPVVTLGDGSEGGNFGISLLKNIGLDECCTYSIEEYIERAVALAQDADLLNVLHSAIRMMMQKSPVMDRQLYMQELEDGYQQIWVQYIHAGR